MSIKVSDLESQLQEDVAQRNGVPTTNQYTRAISEAAQDFSRRCGRPKENTLSVQSGSATYDLPADFLSLIRIVGLYPKRGHTNRTINVDGTPSYGYAEMYEGIVNSASGIIPLGATFEERYQIVNQQITFIPTPVYTLAREYWYKSAWIVTNDGTNDVFADMTSDESEIIMLKAQAICVQYQRNKMAADGWRYQIGDETMDKTAQPNALKELQADLEAQYLAQCERYNNQHMDSL